MSNNHYCGECRWMLYEDTDGDGFCGLKVWPMFLTPIRCDKRACNGFEPQQDGNTCGSCLRFETEDCGETTQDLGDGYCLAQDLFTFQFRRDPACGDFIKKDENNEN
jgi:hypothetical protein